jgi:glycosyltransferase involved in cell wall biosynthesis
MGLAQQTKFLGSVSDTELTGVYNLCDLFILVSERGEGRGEGVPLAVLEALACGKPAIVGDEDGSSESVVNGLNGRIVSPRDSAVLAEVVREILNNEGLRSEMSVFARKIAEERFGYGRFREQAASVLRTLESQSAI